MNSHKLTQTLVCFMGLVVLIQPNFSGAQILDAEAGLKACVVAKSTGADRIVFARSIGAAVLSTDKLADLGKVDALKKVEADKQAAAVFTRLMVKDCLAEAKAMIVEGKKSPFTVVGSTLGEVAMAELLSGQEASKIMGAFAQHISPADFAPLAVKQ